VNVTHASGDHPKHTQSTPPWFFFFLRQEVRLRHCFGKKEPKKKKKTKKGIRIKAHLGSAQSLSQGKGGRDPRTTPIQKKTNKNPKRFRECRR